MERGFFKKKMNIAESKSPEAFRLHGFAKDIMENREMYTLSGDPLLTEKDAERYAESNEKLAKDVVPTIENELKNDNIFIRLEFLRLISLLPKEKRVAPIEKGINDKEAGIRLEYLKHISLLPDEKQKELTEEMLDDKESFVRAEASKHISLLPEEKQKAIIEKIINNNEEPYIHKEALRHLALFSKEDQERMIEKELLNKNLSIQLEAMRFIPLIPEEKQKEIVEKFLGDSRPDIREEVIKYISLLPVEKQKEIVEKGLNDRYSGIRLEALRRVSIFPKEKQKEIIAEELDDLSAAIRLEALKHINIFPTETQESIIENKLNDDFFSVRLKAVSCIASLPEKAQEKFKKKHPFFFPSKEELLSLAQQTPLYKNQPDKFFKRPFVKTGSETTLLDAVPGQPENTLREKVIVRKINLAPYLSWKKAFESYDFWKSKGFDYVPIEPIVDVRLSKPARANAKIDVATRVIKGPSVAAWETRVAPFSKEIKIIEEKIIAGLKELGIEHGHTHDNNFIVYFPRTEKGEVFLNKAPRVYAIDFDMAESSGQ